MKQVTNNPRLVRAGSSRFPAGRPLELCVAPSGGIPPCVGTFLGQAMCDVWDTGTTARNISDTTINVSVLNPFPVAVGVNGDRRIIVGPWMDDKRIFVQEYCTDGLGGGFEPGNDPGSGMPIARILFLDGPFQPGSSPSTGVPLINDPASDLLYATVPP